MLKVILTKEQRAAVDTAVLHHIQKGVARQQDLFVALEDWLKQHMPPREDRFRYVDGSVQRLAKAKLIKPLGNGHYGWKAAKVAK